MSRLQRFLNLGPLCFLYVGALVAVYYTIYTGVCFSHNIPVPSNLTYTSFLWWVGLSAGTWLVGVAIMADEG